MEKKIVTMNDVAKAAGVHQTTVSLAFRNSPKIPADTKKRIFDTANKIGYRKNPLISALMANRIQATRSPHDLKVAYVAAIPNGNEWLKYDPALPDYFPSAAGRFRELGFQLERIDFSSQKMSLERFLEILYSRGIHGLLIAPMPESVNFEGIDLSQFCIISLGRRSVFKGIHRLGRHHGSIMRLCIEKCIEYGYKHIGLSLFMRKQWEGVWEAFTGAYLSHSYRFKGAAMIPPLLAKKIDAEELVKWIETHQIEVLITNKANEVRQSLDEQGLSVPDDIAIVSTDNTNQSIDTSGVLANHAKIAHSAATLMADMLTRFDFGIPKSQFEFLMMGEWQEGGTLIKKDPVPSDRTRDPD